MSNPRNPVLLLHGINDTQAVFHRMTPFLEKKGWTVHSLNMTPCNGDRGLEHLAAQVSSFVAHTFLPDQPFDLVGFSMGGIIARYYVQRLGGINRVQRLVTISSPHHGTWVAYGSSCPAAIQMRPDSAFLQDLNQDSTMLERLNLTSVWTPFDLMIVSASSSQLEIGNNRQVPVLLHPWMLTDKRSIGIVADALAEPLATETSPAIAEFAKLA